MTTTNYQLEYSQHCFCSLVWPEIRQWPIMRGAHQLTKVEGQRNELAQLLDGTGGTDYVVTYPGGLGLLAQRTCNMAANGYVWTTFTVRMALPNGEPTELQKRRTEVLNAALQLTWVVQATVGRGQLQWAAVAEALPFYEWLVCNSDGLERKLNGDQDAWFSSVRVEQLRAAGVPVQDRRL